MKRTIGIGDLHGHDTWREIVEKEKGSDFVFIGDYFDSKQVPVKDQINNFLEIIAFKEANMDSVVLLWGNHDVHYLSFMESRSTGGFQKGPAYIQLNALVDEYKHLFVMAHSIDNVIFTHAGVSEVWLNNMGWINEPIVEFINDVWKYKPLKFEFDSNGLNIDSGDEPHQSPIWIRPRSLEAANKKFLQKHYIQVVGHTARRKLFINPRTNGGKYYYIDTLGITGEYLIIEDNKFFVNKTS